jgi:quinol monooxygenase YgiN
MVHLRLKITAAVGQSPQLLQALHAMSRQALRHDQCAHAHICADVDEAQTFWYVEEWLGREGLERRLKAEEFAQFLALMETGATAPLLEIREMAPAMGLEYVAAIRAASDDATSSDRSRLAPAGRQGEGV